MKGAQLFRSLVLERQRVVMRMLSARMSSLQENKLFTPGPLNTTPTVKSAMMRDLGSRDTEFLEVVAYIRRQLLKLASVSCVCVSCVKCARVRVCYENPLYLNCLHIHNDNASADEFTAIPLQGSGTYSVESVLQSTVPRTSDSRVLVLSGGAYGERIAKICSYLSINHDVLTNPADTAVDLEKLKGQLSSAPYTNVCVVHCETTSGVVNPVENIGSLVKQILPDCTYFIDAMSSFGAVKLNLNTCHADFLVSSANKCIQGVPGFGFVLARTSKLLQCKDNSRSLSLDLYEQYANLEKSGMFRFTPPTHTMLAFKQALVELEDEGGVDKRAERYKQNNKLLSEGMRDLGFEQVVKSKDAGYIITSFRYPSPSFDFDLFYDKLKAKAFYCRPSSVPWKDDQQRYIPYREYWRYPRS
ncbi:hypothetical protein EB796_007863 [Bugula neritina]|uniref:Alanine--glyoxylate aminotransferase n=1 Tax=Bugula neritina TaxID=10212 RepID=A0A7J7K8D5_BUGNE|nr:hypothetical protein EB796_007863 [Bugula neritina]